VDEDAAAVRDRVRASGWDACVVVNSERVVFGLLRSKELDAARPGRRIDEVMRPGPSTFRPHVSAQEMAEYMLDHDLLNAPVTTSDGRLVGLLRREDAAQAALKEHREHAHG
jgi:Mg/Co/Ni transporter MgtE